MMCRNEMVNMYSNFTFWLIQQPKEVQFGYYLAMVIILVIYIAYDILQEP